MKTPLRVQVYASEALANAGAARINAAHGYPRPARRASDGRPVVPPFVVQYVPSLVGGEWVIPVRDEVDPLGPDPRPPGGST